MILLGTKNHPDFWSGRSEFSPLNNLTQAGLR